MDRHITTAPLLVLLSLYLASCSGEPGPVRIAARGSVRLGGERLDAGQIRFVPTSGTTGPAAAATIQNGEYKFTAADGPIVGTHRIEIEATDFLGFAIDDEQAFARFATSGQLRDRKRTRNPVPPEYNVKSTLTRAVDGETEPTFDFDLRAAAVTPRSR